MAQLCQIAVLRASRLWRTRAHKPAGTSSVVFQAELALQGPDDRLHPRWRSQLGKRRGLVFVGASGRVSSSFRSAKNASVSSPPGFVGDDGAGGRWTVGRLGALQLPDGLPFAHQLGVGQAEPGDRALGGTDQQELDAQS
jgi:hypothetical protein